MTEIFKRYIDASVAFRKLESPMARLTDASTAELYDLLYELEAKTDRTAEEHLILCKVYTLLEYHFAAYELFKTIANPDDFKDKSKLYTLAEKAKTHSNSFAIKDIRKLRKVQKKVQYEFKCSDFVLSKDIGSGKYYELSKEEVVIFGKVLHYTDFRVFINKDCRLETHFEVLMAYLRWLADAQSELIAHYNEEAAPILEVEADSDWYDSLEVYSAEVGIGMYGQPYAEISAGDAYSSDHILNVDCAVDEAGQPAIMAMGFDG